ncbi:uncharacterized protein LOC135367986 [Ornithodoros turicata]|uniref:uncharacterized protein LOC135367986 n=1 Tax=Ornithodoros turicata TaxID=34597 RepID=UPI003138D069
MLFLLAACACAAVIASEHNAEGNLQEVVDTREVRTEPPLLWSDRLEELASQGENFTIRQTDANSSDSIKITIEGDAAVTEQPITIIVAGNLSDPAEGNLSQEASDNAKALRTARNLSFRPSQIDSVVSVKESSNTGDKAETTTPQNGTDDAQEKTGEHHQNGTHGKGCTKKSSNQSGKVLRRSGRRLVSIFPFLRSSSPVPSPGKVGEGTPHRHVWDRDFMASLVNQTRIALSKKQVAAGLYGYQEESELKSQGCQPLKESPQIQDRAICPFRFITTLDQRRVPKMMETVQCLCENSPCGARAGFRCVQVKRVVHLMRKMGRNLVERLELLPVACVCAYVGKE